MKTVTQDYKLLKKIKDEKFDVDKLHQYNLYVQLGSRDLQVCIVDKMTKNCLLVEDYILSSVTSYSQLVSILNHLFDDHHLLKAGFWDTIKVALKSNKFSLVPSSMFVEDAMYDYLKLNCKVNRDSDQLLYYKHIKSDAINVFAVNEKLYSWICELYPNKQVGFLHQSSALIEGVMAQLSRHPKDAIFIFVDRFKLHIITSKGKKLEYYNQFSIRKFSDYIKYIMLVMKGLNKDQQSSHVVMWGYIGKQSQHYNEFVKYIREISFGTRPSYLKYSYMFDELQDHHYFDLYNIHLCE